MTLVDVFPAVEVLARHWLAGHADVGPLAPGGVHTQLPADFGGAAATLTVQRVGGVPVERHRLDRARIEVQAWASSEAVASRLARTARAALIGMEGVTVDAGDEAGESHAGFVTAVDDDSPLTWLPDATHVPPIPRYTFAVLVTAHA